MSLRWNRHNEGTSCAQVLELKFLSQLYLNNASMLFFDLFPFNFPEWEQHPYKSKGEAPPLDLHVVGFILWDCLSKRI